jgi:hypothetical protein
VVLAWFSLFFVWCGVVWWFTTRVQRADLPVWVDPLPYTNETAPRTSLHLVVLYVATAAAPSSSAVSGLCSRAREALNALVGSNQRSGLPLPEPLHTTYEVECSVRELSSPLPTSKPSGWCFLTPMNSIYSSPTKSFIVYGRLGRGAACVRTRHRWGRSAFALV